MEVDFKFLPAKKLLIFGTGGVGKTTLTAVLEDNVFKKETPTEDGKLYNNNKIL